jgi:signal transduction histidine kinase
MGVDQWALPGELARAVDPGRPDRRRTVRDWAVDAAMFGLAALAWALELHTSVLPNSNGVPGWLNAADPVLGAAACLAVWARRRYPVATALGASIVAAVATTASGAALLLLFSLALHRRWTVALAVVAATFPLGVPYVLAYTPDRDGGPPFLLAFVTVLLALVLVAGLAVRARRQLVLALRLRAEDARREARHAERELIAREMHDVLAHRLSLLSVHAGALEYRTAAAASGAGPPLTTDEVHSAVGVVRAAAHQAIEELRGVLDVLHHVEAPPGADRLAGLVEEARHGGQRVRAGFGDDLTALPPALQRTVYRVVQEGLTNARKHAAGAAVDVIVCREPGGDVIARVTNPVGTGATIPGAGAGLAGLAERVALHGGELSHRLDDGVFVLEARMAAGA